jgi:hypothetical protein
VVSHSVQSAALPDDLSVEAHTCVPLPVTLRCVKESGGWLMPSLDALDGRIDMHQAVNACIQNHYPEDQ